MVSATELDIFTRSLGGDRRARTELIKKFIRDNSRLGRLATGYSDVNDFLHDCFSNVLRTGQAWDKETNLSQWAVSVGVWTALEHDRERDMTNRAANGEVRMCAEIEGAGPGELVDGYRPPASGADDSPTTRMLAVLGDADQLVFRKRAVEKSTWEETSAAAGKPLGAVGPIFTRAVTRVARLFGAPPAVDDDFGPIFSRVAPDPQEAVGRNVTLQLDPAFYTLTPEMREIGLTATHEFRTLLLWNAAAEAVLPEGPLRGHLRKCRYCASLLGALSRLRNALSLPAGADFRLCPGSFTLAHTQPDEREAFDRHLAECSICRDERARLLIGEAPRQGSAEDEKKRAALKKMAWVTAAVLILGGGSFGAYRFISYQNQEASREKAIALAAATNQNTVSVDPRYRDLVQNVPLDETKIMAATLPANRPIVKYAMDQFAFGEKSKALTASADLASKGNDPGAQTLYAMSLYWTRLMSDGYREMLKAESMSPRDPYRCWITFQFALMVGDKAVIDREAAHLANDVTYKETVQSVMDRVRQRG